MTEQPTQGETLPEWWPPQSGDIAITMRQRNDPGYVPFPMTVVYRHLLGGWVNPNGHDGALTHLINPQPEPDNLRLIIRRDHEVVTADVQRRIAEALEQRGWYGVMTEFVRSLDLAEASR